MREGLEKLIIKFAWPNKLKWIGNVINFDLPILFAVKISARVSSCNFFVVQF